MALDLPDLSMSGPLNRVVPLSPVKLPRPSLVVRFMKKVSIQPDGCWHWTAHLNAGGYGWFRHPETPMAHRASYLLLVGPIPEDTEIDHLCRVRKCVNPDHLEPVSTRVNLRRARPDFWETCQRIHPDKESRIKRRSNGTKGGRLYCLECHLTWERDRKERRRAQQQVDQIAIPEPRDGQSATHLPYT